MKGTDRTLPRAVQQLFPASAHSILVVNAWRPYDGKAAPAVNGPDGWDHISPGPPTRAFLIRLAQQGYTWVNLQASGCAWPLKDAAIDGLLR